MTILARLSSIVAMPNMLANRGTAQEKNNLLTESKNKNVKNMIIDVHCHPVSMPSYIKAMSRMSGSGKSAVRGVTLPSWSVEEQLAMMDKYGIDVCMLSLPDAAESIAGKEGHALARQMNEELATILARHPSRFGAFAAVPQDDMETTLKEMEYALDVLKFDGVCGATNYAGKYFDDPFYSPWFDEMNRRSTTLFVHPEKPDYFSVEESKSNVALLEYMFEQTRMVSNMVLSGAKQRYSKVKIIATHAGGTIPFLARRIASAGTTQFGYKGGPKMTMEEILNVLQTFYYDLTASAFVATLDMTLQFVPTERMLLGFDFPLMSSDDIGPSLKTIKEYGGFTEAEKKNICSGNALSLFPRFKQ